jgi:hypothetical protein
MKDEICPYEGLPLQSMREWFKIIAHNGSIGAVDI